MSAIHKSNHNRQAIVISTQNKRTEKDEGKQFVHTYCWTEYSDKDFELENCLVVAGYIGAALNKVQIDYDLVLRSVNSKFVQLASVHKRSSYS